MRPTAKLHSGQVWVTRSKITRTRSRRITHIVNGLVFYSNGGETTRSCQLRMFRLWIRCYSAIATRNRRPRSLVLREGGAR